MANDIYMAWTSLCLSTMNPDTDIGLYVKVTIYSMLFLRCYFAECSEEHILSVT